MAFKINDTVELQGRVGIVLKLGRLGLNNALTKFRELTNFICNKVFCFTIKVSY